MAFDPLSTSTRKYRGTVVAIASALIVVKTFGVRIEDIPAVGIKIRLAEDIIPVVLALSLAYLTISFVVYLIDDLINYTEGAFTEQNIIQSRGKIENVNAAFEKELAHILKAHVDTGEANRVAKELRWMAFATHANEDGFLVTSIPSELYHLKDSVGESEFEQIRQKTFALYLNHRKVAETVSQERSPLKNYWYFRICRLYILETAFPLVLASLAFATMFSKTLTLFLQIILVPIK